MTHDVVIAGAGPVGLSVALGLSRAGWSVLVLEKEPGTAEHSRAPAIWPRTQEVLAGLGVLVRFRAEGIVLPVVAPVDADRGRVLLRLPIEELADETACPRLLILPQSDTERLLLEALRREGLAEVRFSSEVTELSQDDAGIAVTCRGEGGTERLEALVAFRDRSLLKDLPEVLSTASTARFRPWRPVRGRRRRSISRCRVATSLGTSRPSRSSAAIPSRPPVSSSTSRQIRSRARVIATTSTTAITMTPPASAGCLPRWPSPRCPAPLPGRG